MRKKYIFIAILLLIIGSIYISTFTFANPKIVTIKMDVINVREGPGLTHDVIGQAKKGEKYKVISKQDDWYKIKLRSNETGWIASWLVIEEDASKSTGTVKVDNLNVRTDPDTGSDVLGKLNKNDKVTIIDTQGEWLKISYQSSEAWVSSDYVTYVPPKENEGDEKITIVHDETKIRTQPTTDAPIITKVNRNERYSIIAEENDWYRVELPNGETGFVASWVVRKETIKTDRPSSIAKATIVIDPGHGGKDQGTKGSHGTLEKSVTLRTANLIAKRLEATGANVILTRENDQYVNLATRVAIASENKAHAFISIHYDSTENDRNAKGYTTYYYHPENEKLARTVHQQLGNSMNTIDRDVRVGNYFVIRENYQPSILLELGYLSNPTEELDINSGIYQERVATAVSDALISYFGK